MHSPSRSTNTAASTDSVALQIRRKIGVNEVSSRSRLASGGRAVMESARAARAISVRKAGQSGRGIVCDLDTVVLAQLHEQRVDACLPAFGQELVAQLLGCLVVRSRFSR